MGEFERLENTVTDHAVSIGIMTRAVSSIEALLTQQTMSIKEIEKAMKSQELLMEKFTHLDTRINDSVNRIHKRLDASDSALELHKINTESALKAMAKEHEDKCDMVLPLATKGAFVHKLLVNASIGLAIAVAGVAGTAIMWVIEQGGAK